MTIAPIIRSVSVKAPPDRAFALFTSDIGRWWPRGMTIGAQPHADVVIEKRPGGRWFERAGDGTETRWGKVLAWEPPSRLLLAWQIGADWKYQANLETEVEVTFTPEGKGTMVTLEHRNLERFGDAAQSVVNQLGGGWPKLLQFFADYMEKETAQ
jgi:uncharacterized protein YndB with AHSA1/START domain